MILVICFKLLARDSEMNFNIRRHRRGSPSRSSWRRLKVEGKHIRLGKHVAVSTGVSSDLLHPTRTLIHHPRLAGLPRPKLFVASKLVRSLAEALARVQPHFNPTGTANQRCKILGMPQTSLSATSCRAAGILMRKGCISCPLFRPLIGVQLQMLHELRRFDESAADRDGLCRHPRALRACTDAQGNE